MKRASSAAPATPVIPENELAADPDFVGRRWVFDRLNTWLGQTGRFFHIVGEPGSGKSSLSHQLVYLSGVAPTGVSEFANLQTGFIDAAHFCSARDRRLVNPLVFAESLGSQLAARFPVFMRAMLKASGVTVNVEQHVGVAHDQTIGVIIQELNARSASAEDTFNRLVREPLEALCRAEPNRKIVILIDALDESLVYRGDVGILALLADSDTLPENVRFVLTSRPLPEIDRSLAARIHGVERLAISAAEWDANNQQDIGEYVAKRFALDPRILLRITEAGASAAAASAAAKTVSERAGGNFLYARFLLDAIASGQWRLDELGNAPAAGALRGMDALYLLYMSSLERAIKLGNRDWHTDYAPIMEVLSAAQETLPRDRLRAFAGQKDSAFRANLEGLRQFTEQVTLANGESALRLYHQSFAEFLRIPVLHQENAPDLDNPYHLTIADSHTRIADVLAAESAGDWGSSEDHYALRYAAAHYANAANTDQPERHRRTEILVLLVTDAAFQRSHRAIVNDPVALRADLERTVAVTAADDHPGAPALVVRAALALHALKRDSSDADVLFDAAASGDLDGAESRLALFRADAGWRQLSALTIVWLAASREPAAATSLRNRLAHDGVDPSLELLLARIDAELFGTPVPNLDVLPQAPYEGTVRETLERLAGNSVTGIEPLDAERMNAVEHGGSADDTVAYLAEQDGPLLVSYALQNPGAQSTEYMTRYIAAQAANGYEYYRNHSLWAMVRPVLAHPDPLWARNRLRELCIGALSSSIVQFGQALPLTVLALRGRAGDAQAKVEFEQKRDEARERAVGLSRAREGDPWAHHLRRLISLAEIENCGLGRHSVAAELANHAKSLHFGFAGFNAAARATLSELYRILLPNESANVQESLEMARGSAHNVQDFVFAACATSRVEAFRQKFAATIAGSGLSSIISEFNRDPGSARFAPCHRVGEQFELRSDSAHRLPVPNWARQANTLELLARLYAKPEPEFLKLSDERGWTASEVLDPGTVLPVPDADFAPMLAARLAADVLAAAGLSPVRRARLVQSLVPIAARNYTALDTVLSRLLLAALPADAPSLVHLAESVANYVPDSLMRDAPPLASGLPS